MQAIQPVALQGGNEFADPNSYQARALARTEEQQGINSQSTAKIIQYYALYSIFLATNGVSNIITDSEGILDVPGWIVSSGWDSNTLDPCSGTWFGVDCEGDLVTKLDLFSNLLTGAFPPEVTLLASDGARATGAGALERIDLFDNMLLTNNGDNSWWSQLGSAFGEFSAFVNFVMKQIYLCSVPLSNLYFFTSCYKSYISFFRRLFYTFQDFCFSRTLHFRDLLRGFLPISGNLIALSRLSAVVSLNKIFKVSII